MKDRLLKAALDIGVLAGAALCDYGLYLAWHPLGFITGGLILASACFLAGYDRQRREAFERMREGNGGQQ